MLHMTALFRSLSNHFSLSSKPSSSVLLGPHTKNTKEVWSFWANHLLEIYTQIALINVTPTSKSCSGKEFTMYAVAAYLMFGKYRHFPKFYKTKTLDMHLELHFSCSDWLNEGSYVHFLLPTAKSLSAILVMWTCAKYMHFAKFMDQRRKHTTSV